MEPLVRGAVAAALLSALGSFAPERAPAPLPARRTVVVGDGPTLAPPASATSDAPRAVIDLGCPPRHLPEGGSCVPLPAVDAPLERRSPSQRGLAPRGAAFEILPRRPDRPADPYALRWPLDGEPSFYAEPGDPRDDALSPASVELAAERGARVISLDLQGQEGRATVVGTGRLHGTTVVVSHTVREAGRLRRYLLVYGRLDGLGPSIEVGRSLSEGDVIGFVGDSGSPGYVHLYLDARQVREELDAEGGAGVDLAPLDIARLVEPSLSIAIDPRNLLPLR
jgi:murein DD-endopeptidase MepM/ murein hydrolase activator NlpD